MLTVADARSYRYYDLSHNSVCGQPGAMFAAAGPDWSWSGPSQVNTQATMCQGQNDTPLGDVASENIIGEGQTTGPCPTAHLFPSNGSQCHERRSARVVRKRASLACWGRTASLTTCRVKIFDQKGAEVKAKDGKPFVLWDGCEACVGTSLIDMSGESNRYETPPCGTLIAGTHSDEWSAFD